jgi:hypothetical protein
MTMRAADRRVRRTAVAVLGGAVCGALLAVLLAAMQVRVPLWFGVGLGIVAGCLVVLVADVVGDMEVALPVRRRPRTGGAQPGKGSLATLVRRLETAARDDRVYALHIRPLLLDIAEERLRLRSGRDASGCHADLVRTALGEDLWTTLMRSGPPAAPLTVRELERVVAAIERL